MPISFGKKCPRCGATNYFPLHKKGWFLQLPGVRYYTCSDCHHDFCFIPPCSVLINKRTSERIKPPNTLLVRFNGQQQQFAKIEDISLEGIGFSYDLDQQKFAEEIFTIDLYNCKQGTSLQNLPIQVVTTRVAVREISGKRTTILRSGARFGYLTNTQKKILTNFVESFNRKTN